MSLYKFHIALNEKVVIKTFDKVPRSSQWINGPSLLTVFLDLFPNFTNTSNVILTFYDRSCGKWLCFQDSTNPLDYCRFTLEYPRVFYFRIVNTSDNNNHNIMADISNKSNQTLESQVAWIHRQKFFHCAISRPSLPTSAFIKTRETSSFSSNFYRDNDLLVRCKNCHQPQCIELIEKNRHNCWRQKNKIFESRVLKKEYLKIFDSFTTQIRNIKYCHMRNVSRDVSDDLILYLTQRLYKHASGSTRFFSD